MDLPTELFKKKKKIDNLDSSNQDKRLEHYLVKDMVEWRENGK